MVSSSLAAQSVTLSFDFEAGPLHQIRVIAGELVPPFLLVKSEPRADWSDLY